jgi:hypothetical protein
MKPKIYQVSTHDFKQLSTFHGLNLETSILRVNTVKCSWSPSSDGLTSLLKCRPEYFNQMMSKKLWVGGAGLDLRVNPDGLGRAG